MWKPLQAELLANQQKLELKAHALLENNPKQARAYLTKYGNEWGNKVVEKCWELGDHLWTKYDEKF